jgi:primosomal protein N' (replication factor Y)
MSDIPSLVDVLLPVAFDRTLTYAVPHGMDIAVGDYVTVPLGPRTVTGVVWGFSQGKPPRGLKPLQSRFDCPSMPPELRALIDWVANYTLSPKGMVLRMALGGGEWLENEAPSRVIIKAENAGATGLTPARSRVLAVVADGVGRSKAELSRQAGTSAGVIDGLLRLGLLREDVQPLAPIGCGLQPTHEVTALNERQQAAAYDLVAAVADETFSVTLLEGVTGSGKTEVYLEAVAESLRRNRQALILLPEIALTRALLARIEARFGATPAVWHSHLSSVRRARTCRAIAAGSAQIVVGARSALFLPFARLGIIIVDEEHDTSFKQEETPIYNGRDMAVVRGRNAQVPVVLVSATPSLETQVNARNGRYKRAILPQRFGERALPSVQIVDLVKSPPPKGRFISESLVSAIGETLERGEQALLFLNRRGYAPLTLCRKCGHRFACRDCSAWLVEHRFRKQLTCHHCGHNEPVPSSCPCCGALGELVPCGPGVERLKEEAEALFPNARLAVLSSDLTAPEQMQAELEAVSAGKVDLIIGTQLVTKGHNFLHLTLVGVVDADMGLGTNDPRAAERTFQLLDQVAGRAGRGGKPGHAMLQTFEARHPVMKALASGNRPAFYEAERTMREAAGLPPFGRLAGLVVSATDKNRAIAYARALAGAFPQRDGVRLLGPAEAPLAMVRGRHRQRLLVKTGLDIHLPSLLRLWLAQAPAAKGGVMICVDVDPVSFL